MRVLMSDDPTIGLLETLERFGLVKPFFGAAMYEPSLGKQMIIVNTIRMEYGDRG